MVGAYFSKPDWHSPDFWWPYFPSKDVTLPAEITIDRFTPTAGTKVTILGVKTTKLKWRQAGKNTVIEIPAAWQNKVVGQHAIAFRLS
jgi:hypothetical protein